MKLQTKSWWKARQLDYLTDNRELLQNKMDNLRDQSLAKTHFRNQELGSCYNERKSSIQF